ncbi:MAG: hypothetical protein U0939_27260 [Pirellulales bacterium]
MRICVHEEVTVVREIAGATVCVQQSRSVTLAVDERPVHDDDGDSECDDCGDVIVLCRCMPGEG